MDLTIIIVTHDSAAALAPCLEAIGPALRDRVLVVDNGSADETVSRARAHGVAVIAQAANVGFARAANLAARTSNAATLCFLNPDCVPSPELFAAGAGAVEAGDRRCAVPRFLDEGGHTLAGRQPGYTRLKLLADMIVTNYGETALWRRIRHASGYDDPAWSWPHGACVFIGRRCFLGLGGFDERFFLYMEDVDLGRRLTSAGGSIHSLDHRLPHHRGQGSTIPRRRRVALLNAGRVRYAALRHGPVFAGLLASIGWPSTALRAVIPERHRGRRRR